MKVTSKITHTIELDVAERFDWTKTNAAFSGHDFTVERITLELDNEHATVAFRGPWVKTPENATGSSADNGWQYFLSTIALDMTEMLEAPQHVLAILAAHGMKAVVPCAYPAADPGDCGVPL